ncbi:MAG: CpsB/CapC family capsule biosynthesis tyrosine phosphatase [Rikenellaceae bacterium]
MKNTDFFNRFTDFHSHILPSVDDGVQNLSDSLKILDSYERLGVKKVVFTPHIMEDFRQNNRDFLLNQFEVFKKEYKGGVELHLAAEYMLDSNFEKHLNEGDMLTLFDNYILVETSYFSEPINFISTIKDIASNGYFVVLAHPERYVYMNKSQYKELKDLGVLFQLNILSLTGYYGKQSKINSEYLLKNEMYSFVGGDIHSLEIFKKKIENLKFNNKIINQLNKLLSLQS